MINPKSIIFLLILFSIVLFMIGINLGKTIERIDKKAAVPTPMKISPSLTPIPLTFNQFTHKECGLSFLYPDMFQKKDSSDSALLTYNKDQIKVSCKKEDIKDFNDKKASYKKIRDEIVNNQKIAIYSVGDLEVFIVVNNIVGKQSLVLTSPRMTPLILKSLDFSTQ